jgi:hypothetical protein
MRNDKLLIIIDTMFDDAVLLHIPSPQAKDMKAAGFSRSSPDIVAI